MFGSKNSELTRKYSSTWLEAITFGFSSRCRVWNSQKPIAVKTSASATSAPPAHSSVRWRPRQPAQQREQQRERDVEEHDLLERLGAVLGVDGLHRVEHDRRPSAPTRARPSAPRAPRPAWRARQPRDQPRQRAGADHDVQRDEQVRGAPARLHGHAERQRGQRGHAQHRGPAREQEGQRRPSRPGRPRPRPAPAPRGRARTRAAASPRSRRPAAPASARARRASPTRARAPSGPGRRPPRAPPRAPCRRSAPRPGRRPCHHGRSSGSSAARRAGCRRCCGSPGSRWDRRVAAATPAARPGSRCPCRA